MNSFMSIIKDINQTHYRNILFHFYLRSIKLIFIPLEHNSSIMINRQIIVLITLLFIKFAPGSCQFFKNEEEIEKYQTRLQIQNFISSIVTYPFESLDKKEVGIIIGEVVLTNSDQQDSVFICNSISKDLDSDFTKSMKITLGNYRPELEKISIDNKITFYVIFKIENNDFEISYKNIPEELIGPIKMTLGDRITSSAPGVPDKVIIIKPDSYFQQEIKELKEKYKTLEADSDSQSASAKKTERLIEKRNKKIIENLDELIRRNPFNPDLLLERAYLYSEIGEIEKSRIDYRFVTLYINDEEAKSIAAEKLSVTK